MTTFLIRIIITIIMSIFFISCTDVVDVNVPTAEPRLVIEASLDWEKETAGNEQTIKLSTLAPYFDQEINSIVTGASVKVRNDNNGSEIFFVDQNNGEYTTNNFVPIINNSYTLEVEYNGEIYIAKETLMPVVDISAITQSTEDGFDKNALEVNILFDDPANDENYYLVKFQEQGDILPTMYDVDDEFTNGNTMTIFYEKTEDKDHNVEEFVPGDVVDINLYGISESYHNYMRLLIEQLGEAGNPFATIPVPLRGNCINIDTPDNYALGYFRLTQVVRTNYTFE